MRLIDADELLKEVVGIHDGWLRPPKDWQSIEDSIKKCANYKTKRTIRRKI